MDLDGGMRGKGTFHVWEVLHPEKMPRQITEPFSVSVSVCRHLEGLPAISPGELSRYHGLRWDSFPKNTLERQGIPIHVKFPYVRFGYHGTEPHHTSPLTGAHTSTWMKTALYICVSVPVISTWDFLLYSLVRQAEPHLLELSLCESVTKHVGLRSVPHLWILLLNWVLLSKNSCLASC